MVTEREQFQQYLQAKDREGAVLWAQEQLAGDLDVVRLYQDILTPALRAVADAETPQEVAIWEEHVWTGIVQAVMGAAYSRILQKRPKGKGGPGVVLFCPVDEYHFLGIQMVADFFTLCGYKAYFIGANTPDEEALRAARALEAQYVAISVSNYYHLNQGLKAAALLQKHLPHLTVLMGGYGAQRNEALLQERGLSLLEEYADIEKLAKKDGLL